MYVGEPFLLKVIIMQLLLAVGKPPVELRLTSMLTFAMGPVMPTSGDIDTFHSPSGHLHSGLVRLGSVTTTKFSLKVGCPPSPVGRVLNQLGADILLASPMPGFLGSSPNWLYGVIIGASNARRAKNMIMPRPNMPRLLFMNTFRNREKRLNAKKILSPRVDMKSPIVDSRIHKPIQ
jgi:hypothetical protein